jgi:HK97 family phage major capsid protein
MDHSGQARKSLGQSAVDSEAFKSFMAGQTKSARIELKNTILGESGSPQEPDRVLVPYDRLPGIVPGPFRQHTILDFIPTGATSSNSMEYTREIPAQDSPPGFTNNAAEVAEAGTKPQSDVLFELVNDPVRTIAHWLKLSRQVLDDAPALESYIDSRLRFGIRQRLESQILSGNGTAPNLSGLADAGRHVAYTPVSGDNSFDSISKAKYAMIGRDYNPSAVFLNPADWGAMERLKVGASDDRYIAGEGAALNYLQGGLVPMIWGLQVVPNNNVPAGKFYIVDPSSMTLFQRSGATVEMFEQDDTNVQSNLVTVRAELRAALCVFTPAGVGYGDLTL